MKLGGFDYPVCGDCLPSQTYPITTVKGSEHVRWRRWCISSSCVYLRPDFPCNIAVLKQYYKDAVEKAVG